MVSNTPHRGDIVHLDFDPSSGTFCPKMVWFRGIVCKFANYQKKVVEHLESSA